MSESLTLIFAFIIGISIGAIFYGGLWWTVRQGLQAPQPALWFLTSLLLRMGIAVVGFYYVSHTGFAGLGVCLGGFLAARVGVSLLTRPIDFPVKEGSHPT